ncbi:esterase [Acinetobacter calcoaceticus]|uniref:Esterase n=1 Tax=Acinetobacter calcoaceticus TaxID=471 RepID=A0A4V6NJB8_ACICA|nr:esterase [Acinetobacter calcoaceticus]
MILNFEHTPATQPSAKAAVVLIHGLFGSIGNLGIIARALQQDRDTIQVDVRNHGLSGRSDAMDYAQQAQDILETLDSIGINQFSIVGHSMGGKTAMKLAAIAPARVQQLVVLDMAPFAYQENHHDEIFKALFAVQNAQPETRKQATEMMQQYIQVPMVNQFLLRSFQKGQWLFNVDALYANYANILDWQSIQPYAKPSLFIRGGRSDYLTRQPQVDALLQQFPQAILKTIDNVGHWLHAEQPQLVIDEIQAYLD